jgi:orotidine-5'-phosphate decarboxylase
MGLMDRAFGVDKHTMANYTFTIYWRAAQQRFEEHKEKCSSKSDKSICDDLIEICGDVMKEIDFAKKGFGVFAYEKPFFYSKLERMHELIVKLDFKYEDVDKFAELIIETSNILERRYR